jgi:hypothetical protein
MGTRPPLPTIREFMPNLYYRIEDPSDLRDLTEAMPAWLAAGNPKAEAWMPAPPKVSDDAIWQSGAWVVPPVPTYTAAEWVDAQGFAGNRSTTMLYLKLKLDAAQLTSPKLAAVQAWLDAMIIAGVTAPEERQSAWPVAPFSFEAASSEALQVLNS